jgi:hypothetical protein
MSRDDARNLPHAWMNHPYVNDIGLQSRDASILSSKLTAIWNASSSTSGLELVNAQALMTID